MPTPTKQVTIPVAPVLANGMHPNQYVSISQYGALRNMSTATVRREIKRGNIQCKRLSLRRVGIPATELLK